MKILFICASLEPGRDGVGDYTRKLAVELKKQNIYISLVAFNDRHIKQNVFEQIQTDESENISVTRFSTDAVISFRIKYIKELIKRWNFDWISLQYVPYGFNKKGLPFYLPQAFKQLSSKVKWHFMFHETWVGISSSAPLMHKLYGYFQKKILISLIKKMQPKIITTTNLVYHLALKENKINAACLPLFSNISVHEKDENYLSYLENNYSINLKAEDNFKLGVFGTLYPEANLSVIIPQLIKERKANKKIILMVFGKNNRPDELYKLRKNLAGSVTLIELGELHPFQISNIFKILNEAVLCTPLEYIGKSGAYAALKLHSVNVAVLSSAPIPKYEKDIIQYNDYLVKREAYKWDVKYISQKFISILQGPVSEKVPAC